MNNSRISKYARLVYMLHRYAAQRKRIVVEDKRASQFLFGLVSGIEADPYSAAGCEVRDGVTRSSIATSVVNGALRLIDHNYEYFLAAVDRVGYTPQVVRAAFNHIHRLSQQPFDSEEYAIILDLQVAAKQLPEHQQKVATLLFTGRGPREIGRILGVDHTRVVQNTVRALARVLEENENGNCSVSRMRVVT